MKETVTSKVMHRGVMIKKAIDREITQAEASEALGLSERQVRRLVHRFRKHGLEGLVSRHKGGNNRLSDATRDQAISLVSERYSDFGPTFAWEKLKENHNMRMSRETLRKWMISASIWKGKKRLKHIFTKAEHVEQDLVN